MNIREIRVEGFGAIRDRTLRLEGPVTVFYGPNEAGKSTLLHLIRTVLFGFPPRGGHAADRFEPAAGGAHGGALTVETARGERARVTRRSGDGAGGRGRAPSGGLVTVTLDDGTAGGEELLRELLGGVTGEQFKNLFAFTLTELQELRTLTSGELGGFLHSAGLGVRAAAVTAAERRLAQELDARFKPRGKNQGIGRLLADADQHEADWRRSLASAGRYGAMAEELSRLAQDIAAAEEELRGLKGRRGFLESAALVRDRWLRHRSVLQELAALALPEARGEFPEEGLKRQEELLQELERRAAAVARLLTQRDTLVSRIGAYTAEDAVLLAGRDKLESLLERTALYKSGLSREAEWRHERDRLVEELRSKLDSLGLDSSGEGVEIAGRLSITLEDQAEADRWKERADEADRVRHLLLAELEGMDRSIQDAESKSRERYMELDAQRKRMERQFPVDIREIVAVLPGLIRELRRDQQEAEGLKRDLRYVEERELEFLLQQEQLQAAVSKGAAGSSKALAVLAYVSMAASGILAYGFYMRGELPLAAGALVLLGGIGGGILLFSGRAGTRQETVPLEADGGTARALASTSRPARARSGRAARGVIPASSPPQGPLAAKRQELAAELDKHKLKVKHKLDGILYRREDAASRAGASAEPGQRLWPDMDPEDAGLPDLLEQRMTEMAKALQEEERMVERWKEARRAVDELKARRAGLNSDLERHEAEQSAKQEEWLRWLSRWGTRLELPAGLAPDLLMRLEQIRQAYEQNRRQAQQLSALLEERQRFETDCAELLGTGSKGTGLEELLKRLQLHKQACEEAASRYARKLEAEAGMAELQQELHEEESASERTRAKLAALWSLAGAKDEEEFRRLGAELEKRRSLEQERKALLELMSAGVGAGRLEELDALLELWGARELAEELERLSREAEELSDRLDRYKEDKGRLSAECDKLMDGTEHRDRRDRLEELHTRFREEASQWAVYALAAGLLRKARETYERERQPGVLRQASEHFRRMTGGRYERVIAPFGEQRLVALRPDGEAVDSSRLSRGTAEQLYLSIRFALAAEMANKTPLPLIMDDIFVNFDQKRLEASVRELKQLAEKHQILVFTCHPHVRDTMLSELADTQVIDV